MDKITVVGAGHVGATAAQRIAERELAREVVLVDIVEGLPQGKGLDQWESAPIEGFDTRVVGAQSYEATAGSGIYVVTAGLARTPGMSRDDLVTKNATIIAGISEQIRTYSPDSIIVMVTNPLDVMAYVAKEVTGFQKERVMGMAGVLDTARFRSFLALELDVSVEDIQALVLGGHGDSMVPIVSTVSVGGIPLTQLLSAERIEAIVDRTRKGGGEIVGLLKTGSAYYAPSAAWLEGEYGLDGLFVGVPCKLGTAGIEQILEVELSAGERQALQASAAEVKEVMGVVDLGQPA
jgi:malate dehydrogenase